MLTRIQRLEPRANGRRGVVTWHRRLVNQHGKTTQQGLTQTLVQTTRPPSPPAAPGTADPTEAPLVKKYRTQIVIPADRVVVLHLPEQLREGHATITVQIEEPDAHHDPDHDPDHQDIEWWEEFDDEHA